MITDSKLREEIVAHIRSAGSDSTSFFGYPELEEGLYLQQDPDEFADLIMFLREECPAAELGLDIGIASGGQTKFLRDYYQINKTIVVDIGEHHHFKHWSRIKQEVKSDIFLEIIADSHLPEVRRRLAPYRGMIDFAFVDGDHSYRGLKKDVFLINGLLKTGAIVVFHDTFAVPDCRKVFEELRNSSNYKLLRNIERRFGISIWRFVGDHRNRPNAIARYFNYSFGMGNL